MLFQFTLKIEVKEMTNRRIKKPVMYGIYVSALFLVLGTIYLIEGTLSKGTFKAFAIAIAARTQGNTSITKMEKDQGRLCYKPLASTYGHTHTPKIEFQQ